MTPLALISMLAGALIVLGWHLREWQVIGAGVLAILGALRNAT